MLFPFLSNREGIPRIATNAVNVSDSAVQFSIPAHPLFSTRYNGLVLLRVQQDIPEGTTDTLPIQLTSRFGTINVSTYANETVPVSEFKGTGIYLAYYDSNIGVFQIIL